MDYNNLPQKAERILFNPQDLKARFIHKIDQLFNSVPTDESLWEETPVSPEKFVYGSDFFNDKDKEIFPHVVEDLTKVFSGEHYFPVFRTVLIIGSPGDGKSTTAAFAVAYLTYLLHCLRNPFKYFGLLDTSAIAIMGMAPTGDKARRIVFNKVKKIIERVAWFRDKKYLPDPNIQSELRFTRKSINVRPGNSSQNFPAGEDIIAGIIDESQLFIEKHGDPCEELYYELRRRSSSRFPGQSLIFLTANANLEENFIEKLYDMAREDSSIYAIRRPVYLNPKRFMGLTFKLTAKRERADGTVEEYTFDIPQELENEFKTNPREAIKTYCAIPCLVNEPYIENWDRVLEVMNKNRSDVVPDTGDKVPESPLEVYKRLPDDFRGQPNIKYYVHIDLATGGKGGRGDACGFAMGHRGADVEQLGVKLPTAVIDLVTRFKGGPDAKIDFEEVRQFVQFLKVNRGFNIVKITFDGWNSTDAIQTLIRAGYVADVASANLRCYDTMKTMLYSGRVDFYPNSVLLRELKRLERTTNNVDHNPGGSKDIADCFARVCYMISEEAEVDIAPKESEKKRPRIYGPIMGPSLAKPGFLGRPFTQRPKPI